MNPKLRTVNKVEPPYELNQFPKDFGLRIGKEIIYILATKPKASIEGEEWEAIFARCIGAEWKPSNVGLDDVVLGPCAWCAKSVKSKDPASAKTVRLISGRNSTYYSFDQEITTGIDPNLIGKQVLNIWNE
jgi:hypothetical protein